MSYNLFINVAAYIQHLQKHDVTGVITYHVLLTKVLKAIATLTFIFILSFVFPHMLIVHISLCHLYVVSSHIKLNLL